LLTADTSIDKYAKTGWTDVCPVFAVYAYCKRIAREAKQEKLCGKLDDAELEFWSVWSNSSKTAPTKVRTLHRFFLWVESERV